MHLCMCDVCVWVFVCVLCVYAVCVCMCVMCMCVGGCDSVGVTGVYSQC